MIKETKEPLKMSLQLLASEEEEQEEKAQGLNEEEQKEKTFTQDDVNKLISKAKRKEREKVEVEVFKKFEEKLEEEKRLALLSEKERQQEIERKEKELFHQEKEAFKKEKMIFEAKKLLSERGLDGELADYVVRDNAEDTLTEINKIQDIFNKSYQENINKRLKSSTPTHSNNKKEDIDPFIKGFFKL